MGWSDSEMTPDRDAVGADLAHGPAAPAPAGPRRKRKGRVPLIIGIVLWLIAAPLIVFGVVGTVDTFDTIHSDSTPRGVLSARGDDRPVSVRIGDPEPTKHTVYLLTDGRGLDSDRADLLASRTTCVATLPNERRVTMAGSDQGVSANLGGAVTVGSFTSPAGLVVVACAYTGNPPMGAPAALEFAVAPGSPSDAIGPVFMIVAGGLASVAGLVLIIIGIVRMVSTRR